MALAISLRTRVFVTVGAVLAASIAASALLSRRATLVEVREVVGRPAASLPIGQIGADLESTIGRDGVESLASALAGAARRHGRPFIVLDSAARTIIASSSDRFRSAIVSEASAERGDLVVQVKGPAGVSTVVLKGASSYPLHDPVGTRMGLLVAMPADVDDDGSAATPAHGPVPVWMMATAGVAAIGLILTFTLSKRILDPIGELTDAVKRMEAGDLGARAVRAALSGDEIGRLARSFNALSERLLRHERQRRQMIGDVAHELRSPVTNLRCLLESIQDGLAPADRAAIEALHDETMFLQHLIADLQDLTLAEAGKLDLRLEPVDPAVAIRRAIGTAPVPHGAPIRADLPDDLPPVAADPARLDQILRNLLSNARRHTPDAGVVTVRGRAGPGVVSIEVTDTGEGIEPDHLPQVFERFYRADRSRSRATGGAGLGLAIVRQLAEAQGGTVSAGSEGPGRGATFVVSLPIAAAERAARVARPTDEV